jgi:hypothetical protein
LHDFGKIQIQIGAEKGGLAELPSLREFYSQNVNRSKKREISKLLYLTLGTGPPFLEGVLVKSAVISATAAVISAVITTVVAAAVLPGVLGRAVAVPAAAPAATIAAVSSVTLKARIVPPAHLLPLFTAEGLLASTSIVAAVAGDAAAFARSAAAAAAPSASRISARATAVVARAPHCP